MKVDRKLLYLFLTGTFVGCCSIPETRSTSQPMSYDIRDNNITQDNIERIVEQVFKLHYHNKNGSGHGTMVVFRQVDTGTQFLTAAHCLEGVLWTMDEGQR